MTAVAETTWVVMVLWLACLVLSQIWRDPSGRSGFQAFGSVMGFVLALALFQEGQAVLGLVMIFLNMWLLYIAIDSW
jgi:hypothetical protein